MNPNLRVQPTSLRVGTARVPRSADALVRAVILAACLAALGRRVLFLDLDPQANATSGLGIEKIEGASAYRPLLGEGALSDKIQSTAFDHLEIIPSEVDMC